VQSSPRDAMRGVETSRYGMDGPENSVINNSLSVGETMFNED